MILITSAAYVTPGLIAEFGKLPPCMLPVRNRRLYMHQVKLLQSLKEDIILSLPEDYILSEYDTKQLAYYGVKKICVPTDFTLGASVVYVLNVLGRFSEPVRILHGDTLIDAIPEGNDVCTVAKAEDDYKWTAVKELGNSFVYTGFFSFSSQAILIRCITEQNNDFMKGVESYQKEQKLQLKQTQTWLDFGIVNSYYRSKSKMTTQRVFNDLRIDKYSVTKYSKDSNKILAEANWISSIPPQLKHFVPALWNVGMDGDRGFYEIEYFYLSSLADLFVFGNNPFFVWKGILDACADFIKQTSLHKPSDINDVAQQCVLLYGKKTLKRLKEYTELMGIDMNRSWIINGKEVPALNEIMVNISRDLEIPAPEFMHIMHGDFCFSNILYDFKSQSIKVLDPRGRDLQGNYSIYGDIRYDVAKLAHSVIGLYDFIIGGFFECIYDKEHYSIILNFPFKTELIELQQYFKNIRFAGYTLSELSVYPILVHLFLSMLPLHSDNPFRQEAMLANALKLYSEYEKIEQKKELS